MTKRLLVVFSLLSVLLVGAALVGSTQYVAAKLRHDGRLGPPMTTLAGGPIYEPWAWFGWDERFHRYAPGVFATANLITYGALVISLAPVVLLALVKGRGRGGSTSHGSARWGTTEELRAGGMLGSEGTVLCQTGRAKFSSWLNDTLARKDTHGSRSTD